MGGKEKSESLKTEIIKSRPETKMECIDINEVILQIRGLDADIDKQNLKDKIMSKSEQNRSQFYQSVSKCHHQNRQTGSRNDQIGWSQCHTRYRVDVPYCLKCP